MASPRVFISSTCFDFAEQREGIRDFFEQFGFDVVLSEKGDVFFHPDCHTHQSCVREVANADLMVLLIGGRYGGKYVVDQTKSIVNAEYEQARALRIPVLTLVKREVMNDHKVFKDNPGKDIMFASIEKQVFAESIFAFIDDVRLSETNNGFFPFSSLKECCIYLRKQLAGMLFDYLQDRKGAHRNLELQSIERSSYITESLVERIYEKIDATSAHNQIQVVRDVAECRQFFLCVLKRFGLGALTLERSMRELRIPESWAEFLLQFKGVQLMEQTRLSTGQVVDIILHPGKFGIIVDGELDPSDRETVGRLSTQYEAFRGLSGADQAVVMRDYVKAVPS